jgi:hypothetical protein
MGPCRLNWGVIKCKQKQRAIAAVFDSNVAGVFITVLDMQEFYYTSYEIGK